MKMTKVILNEKNISMYKLSKLTGIPESTINAMANGQIKQPSFNSIVKISKAIKVPLDKFVEEDK